MGSIGSAHGAPGGAPGGTLYRHPPANLRSLAGVGLKPQHFPAILDGLPEIGWFELHSENLMGAGGPLHHALRRIREHYPFSLHGVGLSLGSAGGVDEDHLARVAAVVERYDPFLVSEHLSWSVQGGVYLNDLLPLPLTRQALAQVAENIDRVQTTLRRPILVENPSHYDRFAPAEMSEPEFLNRMAARTGCGILLDVNNVQVTSVNLGGDAVGYIHEIRSAHVGEIHLAGHRSCRSADRRLLIDDHGSPVSPEVWRLYRRALDHIGRVPSLIEWDNNLPAWPVLLAEARKADAILREIDEEGAAIAAAE